LRKFRCHYCEHDIFLREEAVSESVVCEFCGVRNKVPADTSPVTDAEYATLVSQKRRGSADLDVGSGSPPPVSAGLIAGLEAFAWLILVGGVVGAGMVWAEYATLEVPAALYGSKTELDVLGTVAGAACLLNGLFWFLLARVIARTAAAVNELSEGARAN